MHDREQAIEILIEHLKKGQPEYASCQAAGIDVSTLWHWKKDIPGLVERIAEAKRSRVTLLEDALYRVALKGSVTAILTLLRKESKEWKELLDGQIVPRNPEGQAAAIGAAAGAAAVIAMLAPEKRERLRLAMKREGMIIELPPPGTNGNGKNGAH